MKIITKTNLFQEPNIFPANAQNRKFSESSASHKGGYVSLNLSPEGICAFRNHAAMEDQDRVFNIDVLENIPENYVFHPSEGIANEFHTRYVQKNTYGKASGSLEEQFSRNLLSVYAQMYDEIKQGYKDGTREKWVLEDIHNASSKDVYRLVTEEEELAALDETFDYYSYVTDGYVNYGIQMGIDARRAIAHTWGEESTVSEAEEKQAGKDRTQQIMQKLQKIRDNMKIQYINNGRNSMNMIFMHFVKMV